LGYRYRGVKGERPDNFEEIEGTVPLLVGLSANYEIILLSDHAKEWVAYIKSAHPFLGVFRETFFSYELGKTKKDPNTFLEVLERMKYRASECLFIDDNPRNI
jgi:FMN phosphatase YigB (HAD superfamily)